ncbi:MAG: penicillin-binding protein activator [Acidiferrobacterales bacterium]
MPKTLKLFRWIQLFVLVLFISACGTTGRPVATSPGTEVTVEAANEAANNGEYMLAARVLNELATGAKTPEKQDLQLRSVENLIKAGQYNEASLQLRIIKTRRLAKSFKVRKLILLAQIASYEGAHEKSIRLLNKAVSVRNLDPALQAKIYKVMADTEMSLNNPIGAAKNLVLREKYIVKPDEIDENQLKIWEILNEISHSDLQQYLNLARDHTLAGWIELAIEYAGHRTRFDKTVANWSKTHPSHPATPSLLKSLSKPRPRFVGRVGQVAVLLPLSSSRYALAAQAVRQGIKMMDDNNQRLDKPVIKYYDIGDEPGEVTKFYQVAIDQGAQLIIGPLGREAVDLIANYDNASVPTILLGHTNINTDGALAPMFQFGLSPEQEAVQAAERAYLDGYRQAAVLYAENDWGNRMNKAFSEQWEKLGGIVLVQEPYEIKQNDYSGPVKQLLGIDKSLARKNALQTITGVKLKLEPRRRRDIDFIFLAADAKHGRLIKPQLNYWRASRVPVYATSKIFTGQRNPNQDIDLNGIRFGDMPWMLAQRGTIYQLRLLQGKWSYAYSQLDRLFALGIDSYAIIPMLNHISNEDGTRFGGVTSGISLDKYGRFHRQLVWARFKRGVPQLLDKIYEFSGLLKPDKANETTSTP